MYLMTKLDPVLLIFQELTQPLIAESGLMTSLLIKNWSLDKIIGKIINISSFMGLKMLNYSKMLKDP